MSMQSGSDRPGAGAQRTGTYRCCGRLCVLLLGLMASACANIGQIGNLTESPRITVAFESIDGPPPAVFHKFMRTLKDEAGARQIAVVAPGEANYRLRGYLAAHADGGATSIAWAWDVYDASQRRAFRLNGEEKSGAVGGTGWATTDDQVLRRIARTGLDQLAIFAASPRQSSVAAAEPAPQVEKRRSTFAWLDDWAPETAGIFRIFRREKPRAEVVAAIDLPQAEEVPLPRGRPAPDGNTGRALAFAPAND
jgi:hypothetical protein